MVCKVCEDSRAVRRGLIVGGGSGRRFGVQQWKSASRLFPNADNDVTASLECLEYMYVWQTRGEGSDKC